MQPAEWLYQRPQFSARQDELKAEQDSAWQLFLEAERLAKAYPRQPANGSMAHAVIMYVDAASRRDGLLRRRERMFMKSRL